jgi:hypothetical protein
MRENKSSLLLALTLTDAIAMVVGTVIGTGVFLKTAVLTQQLGSPTLVPILFILVALWLVINTITTSPVESLTGLLLIALGLPVYFYFKRQQSHTASRVLFEEIGPLKL